MAIIKIAFIGITGMILSVMLKNIRGEYSAAIGLATTVLIFYYVVSKISYIVDGIEDFVEMSGISERYIGALIKMTGITYLTEIAGGICKDGGCQSIASQIEMFGRISIMGIGMSLVVTLMDTVILSL